MVWVALAVFPQISVAVHMRVMMYLFAQVPGVITSFTVTFTVPEQLSDTVTEAVWPDGTSEAQLKVAACGTPEISGAI